MKFLALVLSLSISLTMAQTLEQDTKRYEACRKEFKTSKTLQGELIKVMQKNIKFKIISNLLIRGILIKKDSLNLKLKLVGLDSIYSPDLEYSGSLETKSGENLILTEEEAYIHISADDKKVDRFGVQKPGQNTIICRASTNIYNKKIVNSENNYRVAQFDQGYSKEVKFEIPEIE